MQDDDSAVDISGIMIVLIKVLKVQESYSDIELKKKLDIIKESNFHYVCESDIEQEFKNCLKRHKADIVYLHQSCAVGSRGQELSNLPYLMKAANIKTAF